MDMLQQQVFHTTAMASNNGSGEEDRGIFKQKDGCGRSKLNSKGTYWDSPKRKAIV
jgi:hypothetical protein